MYNSHHYPGVYQKISFLGIRFSNTVPSILNHNFGSAIIQVISLSRSLTKDIIFIWAKLHRELLENRLCYNSLFWGDQDHPPATTADKCFLENVNIFFIEYVLFVSLGMISVSLRISTMSHCTVTDDVPPLNDINKCYYFQYSLGSRSPEDSWPIMTMTMTLARIPGQKAKPPWRREQMLPRMRWRLKGPTWIDCILH